MSDTKENFIDRCVKGEVLLDEIDDFVDSWHESDSDQDIHEYLGMTEEEYSLWVANPDILPFIVKSRAEGKPLDEILHDLNKMPLAAKADSLAKTQKIISWLKSIDRL